LFTLGDKSGRLEEYAGLLEALAAAIDHSPQVEAVLMSPNVPKAKKAALIGDALAGAPRDFVLFAQAVVRRGRQGWFGDIAREYGALVDVRFNRLRAAVTVAREPDARLRESIRAELSRVFGKEVLPHLRGRAGHPGRHGGEGRRSHLRRVDPPQARTPAPAVAGALSAVR
jgi:F0F1-type ATP synthase delta subunit